MLFVLHVIKVVVHKVIIRQITVISYLPAIQIKLYIFRQRNNFRKRNKV